MVTFRCHLRFQEATFENHRGNQLENPRLQKRQNTSTFLMRRCSRWQVRNLRMFFLLKRIVTKDSTRMLAHPGKTHILNLKIK